MVRNTHTYTQNLLFPTLLGEILGVGERRKCFEETLPNAVAVVPVAPPAPAKAPEATESILKTERESLEALRNTIEEAKKPESPEKEKIARPYFSRDIGISESDKEESTKIHEQATAALKSLNDKVATIGKDEGLQDTKKNEMKTKITTTQTEKVDAFKAKSSPEMTATVDQLYTDLNSLYDEIDGDIQKDQEYVLATQANNFTAFLSLFPEDAKKDFTGMDKIVPVGLEPKAKINFDRLKGFLTGKNIKVEEGSATPKTLTLLVETEKGKEPLKISSVFDLLKLPEMKNDSKTKGMADWIMEGITAKEIEEWEKDKDDSKIESVANYALKTISADQSMLINDRSSLEKWLKDNFSFTDPSANQADNLNKCVHLALLKKFDEQSANTPLTLTIDKASGTFEFRSADQQKNSDFVANKNSLLTIINSVKNGDTDKKYPEISDATTKMLEVQPLKGGPFNFNDQAKRFKGELEKAPFSISVANTQNIVDALSQGAKVGGTGADKENLVNPWLSNSGKFFPTEDQAKSEVQNTEGKALIEAVKSNDKEKIRIAFHTFASIHALNAVYNLSDSKGKDDFKNELTSKGFGAQANAIFEAFESEIGVDPDKTPFLSKFGSLTKTADEADQRDNVSTFTKEQNIKEEARTRMINDKINEHPFLSILAKFFHIDLANLATGEGWLSSLVRGMLEVDFKKGPDGKPLDPPKLLPEDDTYKDAIKGFLADGKIPESRKTFNAFSDLVENFVKAPDTLKNNIKGLENKTDEGSKMAKTLINDSLLLFPDSTIIRGDIAKKTITFRAGIPTDWAKMRVFFGADTENANRGIMEKGTAMVEGLTKGFSSITDSFSIGDSSETALDNLIPTAQENSSKFQEKAEFPAIRSCKAEGDEITISWSNEKSMMRKLVDKVTGKETPPGKTPDPDTSK